ncbi:hypothetical protein CUZ56_01477 [Saezia sanguinis]|uniref:Uncharacterized protein n=1 Tax=Saezia sanguinis TaxID=1965230 RepID=A0A433SD65_9BURK|nr:hypothetical protein CUZ56_01477 [Saezia sanguinis]
MNCCIGIDLRICAGGVGGKIFTGKGDFAAGRVAAIGGVEPHSDINRRTCGT